MTPEEMLQKLGEPFPAAAIKQREGGRGKMLDYVETHTVIHRLNAAAESWDWVITSKEWRDDLLIVTGLLTIPGLGSREGTGVQKIVERAGEDLLKGAASDALKKAATLYGVGLELYGPDYESGELDAHPAPRPAPVARPSYPSPSERQVDNRGTAYPASEKQINYVKVLAKKKKGWDEPRLDEYLSMTHHESIAGLSSRVAKLLIDDWKDLPDGLNVQDEYDDLPLLPQDGDPIQSWTQFYTKWKPNGIYNLQDVARRLGCSLEEVGEDPAVVDAKLSPPF